MATKTIKYAGGSIEIHESVTVDELMAAYRLWRLIADQKLTEFDGRDEDISIKDAFKMANAAQLAVNKANAVLDYCREMDPQYVKTSLRQAAEARRKAEREAN